MAQQDIVGERIRKSYPYVDLLFGTHVGHRLPEFLYKLFKEKGRVFETSTQEKEVVEDIPTKRDGTFKGWLPIMYGCNNFCTYCIVPYVRGRERSREYTEIIKEAKQMIADGFKDITLLGQNVNSYNSPVTDENGLEVDFPKLLHILNNLEGDFRIRFMTSNPKDCSDELLEAMRDCRKVAKHLHLPFQSGSTEVLKRMNRKYDREKYLNLVKKAKELVPEISLTSDVIVGFPGETYEDFCETLSLVKEVKFSALFTFIFSPRNGTVAAQMEDPVSRKEKGKWFRELLKIQEEIAKENEKALSDKTFRLLCDDFGRQEGFMAGHTDTNICLEFKADSSLLGKFVNVKTKYVDGVLTAEII
jgi:tRNA-2-methylthio-N6-dimethylallyladenosine synthase